MNVNNNKLLRTPVVWLFLLAVPGLALFPAYAQTPDPGVVLAQTTDPNTASAQQSGSNPVTEIVSLLQKYDQALNQKDLDALMSLYATGDTTVLTGAGPGKKWVGKAEIGDAYKHFFQDSAKRSRSPPRSISSSGSNFPNLRRK